jgi:hypothetical protein
MGSVGFVERVNCVAAARGQPQWWQWWGNATRSSLSGETQGSCHSMRGPLSFQVAFLASLSLVVARSSCVQWQTAQRHDSAGPYLQSTARASTLQLLARSVRCIVLGCGTISRPSPCKYTLHLSSKHTTRQALEAVDLQPQPRP